MNKVIVGERDRRILDFLWRFKFATTVIIAARFCPESTQWSVYQRLRRLAQGGFIRSLYPDCGEHHFWCLDDKGFEIVRGTLPELTQAGHRSENIKHDFLVLAAHLGSWINGEPKNVRFFTEQELRRIDPSDYPEPIPRSTSHRPDGYWIVENGNQNALLALEVELSQKAWENYDSIARFYFKDAYVNQVIWLVMRKEQGERMLERFDKVVPEGADVHSFALLSDFLKHNWQTKIIIGKDREHTIFESLENSTRTRQEQVLKFDFFDTRKNPKDSGIKQNRKALFDFN